MSEVATAHSMHRWLYSVVPVTLQGYNERLGAYLTGFCPNCRKVFSFPIPTGDSYIEVLSDVPQLGCVGPEGILNVN